MSWKDIIKRAGRYILKGVPKHVIEVNVAQIQSGAILEGKKVLITGGTRGLGLAMARCALEEKAAVTITGRTWEGLEKAKDSLGQLDRLFLIQHDLREVEKAQDVISRAWDNMDGIDIMINNAGVSVHDITYADCSEEDWDLQMDTNLKGTYFLTQAFLNAFEKKEQNFGKIINISSERGLYGDDVPYGLAKRALISYTEGLAVRLIQKGIRVNAIAPGVTATDMTGYAADGELLRESAAGKRVLLSEEIAQVALFLMSDASNCISGQVIVCNEANHLK